MGYIYGIYVGYTHHIQIYIMYIYICVCVWVINGYDDI